MSVLCPPYQIGPGHLPTPSLPEGSGASGRSPLLSGPASSLPHSCFSDQISCTSHICPTQFSSVAQSRPLCDPMDCSTPGLPVHHQLPVYSNSCPMSRRCHPTILSSVVPFSSHLQSFPASGSFPMSQLFASGGQSIGVSASASVLPMNI